jgi:hypothetical protein
MSIAQAYSDVFLFVEDACNGRSPCASCHVDQALEDERVQDLAIEFNWPRMKKGHL